MSLESTKRYLHDNGVYLLGTRLFDLPFSFVRNLMIARKLGVRKINISSRSSLRGLSFVSMGEDFSADEGLWLHAITKYNDQEFSPRIMIGNHVRVSRWVHIAATHLVEIGDNVLVGSKVIIIDHNHGQYSKEHTSPNVAPALRALDHDRRVVVERNVWLGDGVVVAPSSSIGEGSVIGANSVVQGRIPPFSIAAGAPARVLKVFDFNTNNWNPSE
jgi:lipopolysaccharide O-acetyltransferase